MATTLNNILNQSKVELSEYSPSASLDAEVLICHALGIEKKDLILLANQKLSNKKIDQIRGLVTRRKSGEPVAYIIKRKEFYGLDFFVSPAVLIPRPESEWLLRQAIRRIMNKELRIMDPKTIIHNLPRRQAGSLFSILDMGTGSGCLIIALASQLVSQSAGKHIEFYASDISKSALNVARRNAQRLLFEARGRELNNPGSSHLRSNNIKFIHSDLFSNRLLHKKFDLILANLPYVPTPVCHSRENGNPENKNWIPDQVWDDNFSIKFEPRSAIFADNNGAAIIKRFLDQSVNYLAPNGTILIELDPRNAKEIMEYAYSVFSPPETGGARGGMTNIKIELKKDLAGLDRYLIIN